MIVVFATTPEPQLPMDERFRRMCVRREMAIQEGNVDLAFEAQERIEQLLDDYNALRAAVG